MKNIYKNKKLPEFNEVFSMEQGKGEYFPSDELVKAINDSNNENITLFYEPILDEDHATILHKAVYNAFQKLNEK